MKNQNNDHNDHNDHNDETASPCPTVAPALAAGPGLCKATRSGLRCPAPKPPRQKSDFCPHKPEGRARRKALAGSVRIHKRVRCNKVWQREPFTYGQAWIDLLLLAVDASSAPQAVWLRGEQIKLQLGQVGWIVAALAAEWQRSRKWVMALWRYDNLIHFCYDKLSHPPNCLGFPFLVRFRSGKQRGGKCPQLKIFAGSSRIFVMGNGRHEEAHAKGCAPVWGNWEPPAALVAQTCPAMARRIPAAKSAAGKPTALMVCQCCQTERRTPRNLRQRDALTMRRTWPGSNSAGEGVTTATPPASPLVPRESGCKPTTRRLHPGNRLPLRIRAVARQLAPQCVPARNVGCTAGASWRGKPPHNLAKSTFAPRWLAASKSSCACAHAVRLDTTRTPARRNAAASRWLADGLPMACRNGPRTAMARTSLETRRRRRIIRAGASAAMLASL
jgi:hypothetical protein